MRGAVACPTHQSLAPVGTRSISAPGTGVILLSLNVRVLIECLVLHA